MLDKKISLQFTVLTFGLAYLTSAILIILGQFGFAVQDTLQESLQSLPQLLTNVLFTVYISSPAIASYFVLKRNNKIAGFKDWLRLIFYVKNSPFLYLFTVTGLALYFFIHRGISGPTATSLPFYMFFLNLPGNLFIGGLEEAGWMSSIQPTLDKKYGFVLSSLIFGIIWLFWHLPLFFIPGTSHQAGLIDFGMFAVQIIAFRFFYGAIYKISGKGGIFLCILFHTMFNAGSHVFGILPMTWTGTLVSNAVLVVIALITVRLYEKRAGVL